MTSAEKIAAQLAELRDVQPTDMTSAMLVQAIGILSPMLEVVMPTDPAELDRMLLDGAKLALGLRSDDAWQPETITDLFLGANADADENKRLAEIEDGETRPEGSPEDAS